MTDEQEGASESEIEMATRTAHNDLVRVEANHSKATGGEPVYNRTWGDVHAAIDALAAIARRMREERDGMRRDYDDLAEAAHEDQRQRDKARALHDEHCAGVGPWHTVPTKCNPPWRKA